MSTPSPKEEVVRPNEDSKKFDKSNDDPEKQGHSISRHQSSGDNGVLGKEIQQQLAQHEEEMARVDAGGLNVAFERKIFLINKVMQDEIGMGRFQWGLFATCGLGWTIDNLWLQGVAIILPEVGKEFADATYTAWMTFSLYVGLILGAFTWGFLADIVGRRLSFNATLFIGGVFGIAGGGAPSFTGLGGLLAALGFGVGGSLPVDGMLFLEFIPGSHQYLLTLLSIFWAVGQLIASLIAWAFIANYTCAGSNSAPATAGPCNTAENMGWRYTFYTLGAFTLVSFILRFFIIRLPESPKFLIAHNRDAEAVAVIRDIARRNGKSLPDDVLSVAILKAAAGEDSDVPEDVPEIKTGIKSVLGDIVAVPKAFGQAVKGMNAKSFKPNWSRARPLFATKKLTYNTLVLWACWALIGISYPLYNAFLPSYLADRFTGDNSTYATYRDYAIISACGVPGSLIAAWLVELPRSGRRGALAISTLATGVFIFGLSGAQTSDAYLGLNCAAALVQNSMYGVLYAITPESFPSPVRGLGDGVASSLNRVTGILAPVIRITSNNASAPLFISGALFIVSAALSATLPVETAGRSAL